MVLVIRLCQVKPFPLFRFPFTNPASFALYFLPNFNSRYASIIVVSRYDYINDTPLYLQELPPRLHQKKYRMWADGMTEEEAGEDLGVKSGECLGMLFVGWLLVWVLGLG